MQLAKKVSARLLAGEKIRICVEEGGTYTGTLPEGLVFDAETPDVYIGIRRWPDSTRTDVEEDTMGKRNCLHLVPKISYLGVGCKKGTSLNQIETAVFSILEKKKELSLRQ